MPIPGMLIGIAYGVSVLGAKIAAAGGLLAITKTVLGTVSAAASVAGGSIMAVEAANRGDIGRALYSAGKAGNTLERNV